MSQREIMLESEGDNYYKRNFEYDLNMIESKKAIVSIKECMDFIEKNRNLFPKKIKILEIGCGIGKNLAYICDNNKECVCTGIEPSKNAVKEGNDIANKLKLNYKIVEGMSDELPFQDEKFDIIICGFFFYTTLQLF